MDTNSTHSRSARGEKPVKAERKAGFSHVQPGHREHDPYPDALTIKPPATGGTRKPKLKNEGG